MKRLLFACLLLLPTTAFSRVLIIDPSGTSASNQAEIRRQLGWITGILHTFNAPYDVVSWKAVRTDWLRREIYVNNFPGIGPDSVHYHALIVPCYDRNQYLNSTGTPARPDSLDLAAYNAQVPVIYFFDPSTPTTTPGTNDTTGVGSNLGYSAVRDTTYNVWAVGYPETWKEQVNPALMTSDGGTTFRIASGRYFRAILGYGAAGGHIDRDSVVRSMNAVRMGYTGPDTLSLWVTVGNAALASTAPCIHSTWHPATNGGDISQIMCALAMADSASGGNVFSDKRRVPLKIGLHIDDGFKRGRSNEGATGGIVGVPSDRVSPDSVAFKASIDSLATLAVPFVVGVEIDSLGFYGNDGPDAAWWERASPYVHYTIHAHHGATNNDPVAAAGVNFRVADLWGDQRARTAAAVAAGAASDSSIESMGLYGFLQLRARFGAGRVDHIGMPPFDDWSPTNLNAMTYDSLYSYASAGGFTGVRTNAACNSCNSYTPRTANYGIGQEQRTLRIRYGRNAGGNFRILAMNGYPNQGSKRYLNTALYTFGRCLNWAVLGINAMNTVPAQQNTSGEARCQICAIHAGDLGSDSNGTASRPGYYIFKQLVHQVRTINRLAGRTIVQIDYPQNIEPLP